MDRREIMMNFNHCRSGNNNIQVKFHHRIPIKIKSKNAILIVELHKT
jgi:hypothetical protein